MQYQAPVEVYNVESLSGSRPANQNLFDSRLAIDGKVKLILDLLNSMFPPEFWEAEGKNFKRNISTNPPSRDDVNTLQKLLDEKLVFRQAR